MILSEQNRRQITQNIKQVESESGAELVAVIAYKSGDYTLTWLVLNLFLVFLVSAIFALTTSISAILLLNLQMSLLAVFYFVFSYFGDYFITFLPSVYKKNKASDFAQEQFAQLGIGKTKTRQGVMFFVSVKERFVKIIADEAISKKIDDSFWEDIVKNFILHVKKDEFALGYVEAINACGDVLIEKFPIRDDDENELSDEVIEL